MGAAGLALHGKRVGQELVPSSQAGQPMTQRVSAEITRQPVPQGSARPGVRSLGPHLALAWTPPAWAPLTKPGTEADARTHFPQLLLLYSPPTCLS